MIFKKIFIIMFIICLPSFSLAQEISPVSVIEMAFCKTIKGRNPISIDSIFSDSVERVFCYTKLSSTEDYTSISHVWYYNDTQMAIVDLPVNAKTWRTWSSKRIVKDWAGVWRVDVISSTGNIICSDEFVISSNAE